MIVTDLLDEGWPAAVNWADLANNAVREAIMATPHSAFESCSATMELSVRLTSDAEVHSLNRDYRDKDKPTNVLSFPMYAPDDVGDLPTSSDPEILLGDIVLAQETCAREADEKGVTLSAHATHLIVHGVLHLLGYDHMGQEEAETMEAVERRVMARLGLHDPYGD